MPKVTKEPPRPTHAIWIRVHERYGTRYGTPVAIVGERGGKYPGLLVQPLELTSWRPVAAVKPSKVQPGELEILSLDQLQVRYADTPTQESFI